MASSLINFAPLVATITGSTTMFSAWYSQSFFAIDLISPVEETIPIFTASGRISVNTLSICCSRNSGVTSKIPWTPVVFWAVSAVIALIPYTPLAIIVFKSAWIPAPPLQSLPAIVNAVFIINSFQASITFIRRHKVVPPMCRHKKLFAKFLTIFL